jgi:hypothetical protein
MREDHEEAIIRNPAYGAAAFWHLARSFSDQAEGRTPMLAHFLLAEGMLFHHRTVQKIRGMNLDSGLLKAISEVPDIVAGLQGRVEDAMAEALRALQVGTAAGILLREHGGGLPTFRAVGNDLPKQIRRADGRLDETFAAAKRLGAWYAMEGLPTLLHRLGVRL